MNKIKELYMEALSVSLKNKHVQWNDEITMEEWINLFRMANVHHVLPMIYEAVYDNTSLTALGPGFTMQIKRQVFQTISMQAMRTNEFQVLYEYLFQNGIIPCVVKGVICRELYPNPDARVSGDEDLFIPAEQFLKCHNLLIQYGMVLSEPSMDIEKTFEVAYVKPGSMLYIELHKHMFPPESEAYGNLNRFFDGIHTRGNGIHAGNCGLIEEDINGTKFLTMNPTDHLLYLIMHAFKHFLHSGFGLRQVCDINLYAMKNGNEIDWSYILECCREVRADLFAAAMFKIGEKYLIFNSKKAGYPAEWKYLEVDESIMLEDLLDSGVFGQSNMSRKHSSNITLNAVIADKRGEKAGNSKIKHVIKAICLPANALTDRFTYLKKMPFLLPVAWLQRLWIYHIETTGKQSSNNAVDSIKIGNERVELLRKYGIIK